MAAALLALLSFVQVGAWKNSEALFRHMIRKLGNDPYRSDIYWRLGMVLSSEGRMAEAEVHFKESLLLAPGTAEARVSYGDALFREGRKAEAAAQYAAALRINPSFPLPHARLAQELAGQGRFDEAMTHCQAALSMDPNCVEALNNLAWLLATCPDDKLRNGPTATALAERAAALTRHRFVQIEGTLAAAYAEAGLFAKAIEAGARAGAMASALGDTNLVARYEQDLNLYRRGQAREAPVGTLSGEK